MTNIKTVLWYYFRLGICIFFTAGCLYIPFAFIIKIAYDVLEISDLVMMLICTFIVTIPAAFYYISHLQKIQAERMVNKWKKRMKFKIDVAELDKIEKQLKEIIYKSP